MKRRGFIGNLIAAALVVLLPKRGLSAGQLDGAETILTDSGNFLVVDPLYAPFELSGVADRSWWDVEKALDSLAQRDAKEYYDTHSGEVIVPLGRTFFMDEDNTVGIVPKPQLTRYGSPIVRGQRVYAREGRYTKLTWRDYVRVR